MMYAVFQVITASLVNVLWMENLQLGQYIMCRFKDHLTQNRVSAVAIAKESASPDFPIAE